MPYKVGMIWACFVTFMCKIREVLVMVLLNWHCRPAWVMALLEPLALEVRGRVSNIDCLVTAVSLVLHHSRHQD